MPWLPHFSISRIKSMDFSMAKAGQHWKGEHMEDRASLSKAADKVNSRMALNLHP